MLGILTLSVRARGDTNVVAGLAENTGHILADNCLVSVTAKKLICFFNSDMKSVKDVLGI